MKLVTFTHGGNRRIGAVADDGVVDFAKAAPGLPQDMLAFLEAGRPALSAAHAALEGAARIPLAEVRLEAPIARPPKFLAVGLNYADHVAESGPTWPSRGRRLRRSR
jgi:2-keto-4-pentenoate hydratase/2-oxohepta-3-ene-1,7-dioic acid hydratase in catechol pathway